MFLSHHLIFISPVQYNLQGFIGWLYFLEKMSLKSNMTAQYSGGEKSCVTPNSLGEISPHQPPVRWAAWMLFQSLVSQFIYYQI